MSTIPASEIVQVNPSVLAAGGRSLDMNGILVTQSTRVPIGTVPGFATALDVANYFGPASPEAAQAAVYFDGFINSHIKPAQMLAVQYPGTAVAAYVRGGTISGLTLQQLQLLSGSLSVVVDGYTWSAASIDLAAATSFSAAAAIIQAALISVVPTVATCTGSIGPKTASFTGVIAGHLLTVTSLTGTTLQVGATVAGTGVVAGTRITGQLSGVAGLAGVYAVNNSQDIASEAMTATYGLLNVTIGGTGFIQPGLVVTGSGVTASTLLTAQLSGTLGGVGVYVVAPAQTVSSTLLTLKGAAPTVTYDSITAAFAVTSGITGAYSTIAYGTGTLATPLNLTNASGAVLSQGADPATPTPFMNSITNITQNWATFWTLFDPDYDSGDNTQKLLFAQWVNSTNNRYAYVCWDTDESPAVSVPDTTSLGYLLRQSNSSGTFLIGMGQGASNNAGGASPVTAEYAAFVCGSAAAIDFTQFNGRTTFAFRRKSGLNPTVTDATSASNLLQNGYNVYGAYATANDDFIWMYNGSISGQFLWMDSYIDQIWMNNGFQLALMVLLRDAKSIPYNTAGYALISAACKDQILAALNFGAIRTGVTLSESQAAQVNSQAGIKIDDILNRQGWYLQIRDAAPLTRQARGSPPCTFWYMDGQSVQRIVLESIELV